MDKFIKGMDVSSLPEETALGARFYDEGKEGDALEILKKYGANSLRIRLWNDPYSEDGKPYSAGTSDFTKLVALASAGKKLGYSYLLDLHYSDFWADPGKQFPPKEWAYADADALEKHVYDYTKDVLCCDIHTRARTKRLLKKHGAETVYGLDDILTAPVNGSGYNDFCGLLGSNKATEDTIKLFPVNCQEFVERVQKLMLEKTGKTVEVLVYGDGAFKDPVGKIWELADPVVSPGYTAGLTGTPNELKLKYLADNDFADLSGDELKAAISEKIKEKDGDLKGQMASEGTTPRRLTDLIGSLCDLTSGSGDKGTPIIYIQGYFDNYTK